MLLTALGAAFMLAASMAPAEAPSEGEAAMTPGRGPGTRRPDRVMPSASARRGGARETLTRPPARSTPPGKVMETIVVPCGASMVAPAGRERPRKAVVHTQTASRD